MLPAKVFCFLSLDMKFYPFLKLLMFNIWRCCLRKCCWDNFNRPAIRELVCVCVLQAWFCVYSMSFCEWYVWSIGRSYADTWKISKKSFVMPYIVLRKFVSTFLSLNMRAYFFYLASVNWGDGDLFENDDACSLAVLAPALVVRSFNFLHKPVSRS